MIFFEVLNSSLTFFAVSVVGLLVGIRLLSVRAADLPVLLVNFARVEQVVALSLIGVLWASPILSFDNDYCYFLSRRLVQSLGSKEATDHYVDLFPPLFFFLIFTFLYFGGFLATSPWKLSINVRVGFIISGPILCVLLGTGILWYVHRSFVL